MLDPLAVSLAALLALARRRAVGGGAWPVLSLGPAGCGPSSARSARRQACQPQRAPARTRRIPTGLRRHARLTTTPAASQRAGPPARSEVSGAGSAPLDQVGDDPPTGRTTATVCSLRLRQQSRQDCPNGEKPEVFNRVRGEAATALYRGAEWHRTPAANRRAHHAIRSAGQLRAPNLTSAAATCRRRRD